MNPRTEAGNASGARCGISKSEDQKAVRTAIMTSRALKIDLSNSGTSQPTDSTESNASETVTESAIAARAYQLWQEHGCPIGSDQEDRFRAEEDLKTLAKLQAV
jgi:hypothetical protein